MLSPGIVLQQRYRIKRLLARGGMGAVYEAEDGRLRNATVAVKETFFSEDRQSLREQFEREAATLARLRHPALPQVKYHFIEGGGQFLVMDFIEGADLGALLKQRLNNKGDNLPVTNVAWDEAKDFCRRLSQMTGDEYRLPTEAEWEYACRAGTTGPYAGDLNAMAWHIENSNFGSHPVGRKRPNTFGIYDMQGNVREWCEDFWHNDYEGAPTNGSAWMDNSSSGGSRVVRGCDWSGSPFQCRSASRDSWSAGLRMDYAGFRIVRAYR